MIIKTTNVVVIDDVYDEVENLFRMLNHEGIGFVYYSGTNYREFPARPLKGVRFLFLDFVLDTDGQSSRNKISTLMGVVKKVIFKDNGPYIIFAWTKHDSPVDDLFALFKEEILKDPQFPQPVVIINLEKNKCMNNPNMINKKLNEKFGDENILKFILYWENYARDALCDVIRILLDISKPVVKSGQSFDNYSADWNAQIEKCIYRIAETSLGENIGADRNLLVMAQLALTVPFHDCAETLVKKNTGYSKELVKKIISHKDEEYNFVEKAVMNTFFLLTRQEIDKRIQPGNIYKFTDVFKKIKCKEKSCYYNKIKLTKQGIAQEFYGGSIKTCRNKSTLLKKIIPILFEITPECDYVQKKWKTSILILGILWPKIFEKALSANSKDCKPDYVYKALPVEYQDEVYYLTFNAHHIFNIGFHIFASVEPILKARKELLIDIQHWFSAHISRPGKTEF
ncbi:hypothetical protein D4R86_00765 [bacterium]|nr:MAG: hypothetical protein D4R86_00765 [bacterium]